MSKRQNFNAAEKYEAALEAIKGKLAQAQITAQHKAHTRQLAKVNAGRSSVCLNFGSG